MTHQLKLMFFAFLLGCNTLDSSSEVSNDIFDTIHQDDEYESLLKTYSHSASIFQDFDKLYDVHVTFLSSEFMRAFEKRLKERFKYQTMIDDVNGNIGFFVSIFSPLGNLSELNQEKIWEILLSINGVDSHPDLVKSLKAKENWSTFFPYITLWSNEYLVLFKMPSGEGSSEAVQSKEKVTLSLSNLQAKTVMTW
ncbi:MAG: hypothetical protein HYW48_04195 [Deltaproteobacteria bacterium]|nr:hypothetical protein [Deltaproteobacteria bacterium]